MHLNRLRMHNFKKYRDCDVKFQDGLTGIVGRNGAGKSTIVEAIAWALYGNKVSTIKRDLIKNTSARESEPVDVHLDLDIGRQKLRIIRSMKGKNLTPEAALFIGEKKVATGTREVDQRLEAILKISFQDFMKTFYARQKDLDNLLKEGGMGKREYLLTLLGLDDIREKAIDIVRTDAKQLDGTKNRLIGSLAEIGDVAGKVRETGDKIVSARVGFFKATRAENEISASLEKSKEALELEVERKRSHDLLIERVAGLKKALADKSEIAISESKRLEKIEVGKRQLEDLASKLARLDSVKRGLDELEPKKKKYDYLLQRKIKIEAQIDGKLKFLHDSERRLVALENDRSELESLQPLDFEYQELAKNHKDLELMRDRFLELRASLGKETARLDALKETISREEDAIARLKEVEKRLLEMKPLKVTYEAYQKEILDLAGQAEAQKELERMLAGKDRIADRAGKLAYQRDAFLETLSGLGELDAEEKELRHQDRELDILGSELNNRQGELRAEIGLLESKRTEAIKNLSRIKGLGAESDCPTCERPLGKQHTLLVEKYERSAALAEGTITGLKEDMAKCADRINGVIASRSRLKIAFDQLGAKKSQRAELQVQKSGIEAQLDELALEIETIEEAIEALGPVSYDSKRHARVQAAIEELGSRMEEYTGLAARAKELPKRESQHDELIREKVAFEERVENISRQMTELGYDESRYIEMRGRISELKQVHDRCSLLAQRILEIPHLGETIEGYREEAERLRADTEGCQKEIDALGFDPVEHESLLKERKDLSRVEEAANRIRMVIASEDEVRQRLFEAKEAGEKLSADLATVEEKLAALGYREEKHLSAKLALKDAQARLEAAKEEVSRWQVRLKVLEKETERLQSDAKRKEEYERELSETIKQLQVVETTRTLVNRFVDHILVRIREEIARRAGLILDEVTGKYSTLIIDDDFNILVEDGGSFYPISRYSGGEIDMIAVSVRVAISEYLMRFSQDRSGYSFLILDEVFGSQDVEHRESMINMLRNLDDRFPQVFAISHISEVQGQFDNTIHVVEDEVGCSHAMVG
jgi:exonuclease SbcC